MTTPSVDSALAPLRVRGPAAAGWYARFLQDPLDATTRLHAAHGPLVELPHPQTPGRPSRALVVAIGPAFNREVLGSPDVWRTVDIGPGGPKDSAVRRLSQGLIRMSGDQHAHYRKLLLPPLQQKNVNALGEQLQRLAIDQVASWPVDQPIDLWTLVKQLLRTFAIGLLFGDDRVRGYAIADGINRGADYNWSWKVLGCPIDLPGTPYHEMVQRAAELETSIIEWAASKRGPIDHRDLLSIVVNSPDEKGCAASNQLVAGQVPTLFGAAYETSQNALIWTLVLLNQHQRCAANLYEDLRRPNAGDAPSYDEIARQPLLDAVVKESLRILPPVPQQFRVALRDTTLGGHACPERTRVLLSPFLTNRQPDLYPEADRFKPERWADISPSPYEYAVFSAGPRGCPGYAFALAMVKVAVATIITRYRIELRRDAPVDYKVRVTLSPRRQVSAVLHRQDGVFASTPVRGSIRRLVRFPS